MIIIKDKGNNSQIYVPRTASVDGNNVYITEKEFNRIISAYAEKSDLHHKQDRLFNGKNIKTINGKDILGEGNLDISVSNVVELTQDEYNNLVKTGQINQDTLYMITDAEISIPYITGSQMVEYVDDTVGDINKILEDILG